LRNQTKAEKLKSIYRGSPAFAEATARQTWMGEKQLDMRAGAVSHHGYSAGDAQRRSYRFSSWFPNSFLCNGFGRFALVEREG
jgi:hypothetical protein